MPMSHFEAKLAVLEKTLNCPLEHKGNTAAFLIDDLPYDFYFEEETGKLMVYACLVALPDELPEAERTPVLAAIFQMLLKAQFCFSESGGFSFGVDPKVTMVNLQALLPLAEMSDEAFLAEIEKFVRLANVWTKRLEARLAFYLSAATPPTPGPEGTDSLIIKG